MSRQAKPPVIYQFVISAQIDCANRTNIELTTHSKVEHTSQKVEEHGSGGQLGNKCNSFVVQGVEQHAAIKPRLKLNSCPNSLPNEPKTNAAHKMANKTFQLWFASWHHPRFLRSCPALLLGETFIKMKESRKFYRVFRQAAGNSNNNNNFRKSNNKKWE